MQSQKRNRKPFGVRCLKCSHYIAWADTKNKMPGLEHSSRPFGISRPTRLPKCTRGATKQMKPSNGLKRPFNIETLDSVTFCLIRRSETYTMIRAGIPFWTRSACSKPGTRCRLNTSGPGYKFLQSERLFPSRNGRDWTVLKKG